MIREATYDDVLWVVKRLKEEDKREIIALGYTDGGRLARNAFLSDICLVALKGDEPITLFGADCLGDAKWNAWMMSTDHFDQIFGRRVKRGFQERIVPFILKKGGTFVQALSSERHTKAHFFIERLGGVKTEDFTWQGPSGQDFRVYTWDRDKLEEILHVKPHGVQIAQRGFKQPERHLDG
jgi:hypothetical protein